MAEMSHEDKLNYVIKNLPEIARRFHERAGNESEKEYVAESLYDSLKAFTKAVGNNKCRGDMIDCGDGRCITPPDVC